MNIADKIKEEVKTSATSHIEEKVTELKDKASNATSTGAKVLYLGLAGFGAAVLACITQYGDTIMQAVETFIISLF